MPGFVDNEARLIASMLLDGRVDRMHIRKPGATAGDVAALISQIPAELHSRLSLHYHHELADKFPAIRLHLNACNPYLPANYDFAKRGFSRSCHSLEELAGNSNRAGNHTGNQPGGHISTDPEPEADYQFLSPIFDCISKHGYRAAFSPEKLHEAARLGIINNRVIALGGVTPEKFEILREIGFGGAAMLGCLWKSS